MGKGVGRITPGVGASVLLVPANAAGAPARKREIDSFMIYWLMNFAWIVVRVGSSNQ